MKKQAKAEPRGRRSYPQEARVFSTNFLPQMQAQEKRCFVAYEDFLVLQIKYLRLFKRYRKYRNGK